MFTGLITSLGRIEAIEANDAGGTIVVQHEPWDDPVEQGESIAVNGCCLTASGVEPGRFRCELLKETLDRTSLGQNGVGDRINLERALSVGDRLGGHILSGHIDGLGKISEIRELGRDREYAISCDPCLANGMVMKGSIACDGISLTLTGVSTNGFSVHIIPFTLEHTNLGFHKAGNFVNIEIDMIGKYVKKHLADAGL
jgi:riboflavin synthase